ncbi:MAG TPA: condensation domain-containing protein, partial [Opitutaceae bacterium]|nr:condensation domain-containing protein [Opitutaceae bacterium]
MVRDTTVDGDCGAVAYPLSPMQQGMLFHHAEGAAPGIDVEQVVCEMEHPIGAAEFEQAWQAMVRRHDTLRTGFIWSEGGEPRQVVSPPDTVAISVRVLELADAATARRMVQQYLASDRRTGFATLAAPLARVALFRGGDRRAWFVFTYHHLILDARGMLTLFRELMEYHDALVRGETVDWPEPRPYRDYIAWLETLDQHRAEAFWREQLRGLASPTLLPLPAPDVDARSEGPGELAFRLSEAETRRLRAAAERHGVTLNTMLQAAWAVVLSRYTGEDDIVFGAVRACRHIPVEGAAAMVGLLINTVPVRVRLAPAASIGHWVRALREQWLAIRDFEPTPLARIQQCTDLPAGRPLFDTLFNFQEPSWMHALNRLGGRWTQREFDIRSQPNYPLALDIYGDPELLVRAFYNARQFDAAAVGRLLGHYRAAIQSLMDPQVDTLAEVTLLDAPERDLVIRQWNRTAAEDPLDVCVHELFERQAVEQADRIAIADSRDALSYAELNRRANALARRLRALGVQSDTLVAVCLPRSIELIVAWLGVLKSGGAFVSLDPAYPRERLDFQIRDSAARVVITAPASGS